MSELKAHKAYNRWIDEEMPTPNDDLICNEVYLKSEADKVIEKLKHEIEKQKRLRDMALSSVPNVLKVMKIIQHHKYKRCLAIADSCALRTVVAKMENRSFPTPKNSRRMILYPKWYKRWLAIAETFKTNSTAQ